MTFKLNALKWPFLSIFLLIVFAVLVHLIAAIGFGISWQESISMPEGWYATLPVKTIHRGEVLVFKPPGTAMKIMLKHHWILPNSEMMKIAAAVPGDKVCLKQGEVWINQKAYAPVFEDYKPGHPLPHLSLCRRLNHNEYMMMSTHIPNSFDSRYFGPIDRSQILARAIKL